jgi:isopentenyldiphosphate isomerase
MDEELLDVFDERGRHRGAKPRGDVHRDGDWHLAFHLWVVSPAGVLLQRRARDKASWPGYLDASAAGHLLAGEAIADGLREAEEELGAVYAFDALTPLGVHRVAEEQAGGIVNREHQHVFGVVDDRPLAAWDAFDRTELDGLVLVGHDGFAALAGAAAGAGGPAAEAPARAWDGAAERPVVVRSDELVPAPYLPALAAPLRALAVSTRHR